MKKTIYDESESFDYYEDFKDQCEQINGYFIFDGYFGAWNGKIPGGGVKTFLIDAIDSIRPNSYNCSEVYLDRNGNTWVENHHHDGSSKISVKQLTSKGINWYENNRWKFTKEEIVKHLLNIKCYTKRINWQF